MLSSDEKDCLGPTAPFTASDSKVYRRICSICFLFREQLDMNSELQKENDQFVSLLLTYNYMTFNCNYFTVRLRTT